MGFCHERLAVYGAAIGYVGWAYRQCEGIKGHRNVKDPWLRAAQGIDSDSDADADPEGNTLTEKCRTRCSIRPRHEAIGQANGVPSLALAGEPRR